MRFLSTSSKLFCISLAITGVAAMLSGTMAACSPIDVPTINLVSGVIATINIITGKALIVFTKKPTVLYIFLFSFKSLDPVTVNIIPIIVPNITEISIENSSILNVANKAGTIILGIYSNNLVDEKFIIHHLLCQIFH